MHAVALGAAIVFVSLHSNAVPGRGKKYARSQIAINVHIIIFTWSYMH